MSQPADSVARKERFLAAHPGVVIGHDQDAPPYERWRGRVPGHEPVTSGDLGQLLDWLEEIIAADEAGQRWPGWAFTRIGSQWKAHEAAGTRAVFAPTLAGAEARVRGEELRAGRGTPAAPPPTACQGPATAPATSPGHSPGTPPPDSRSPAAPPPVPGNPRPGSSRRHA